VPGFAGRLKVVAVNMCGPPAWQELLQRERAYDVPGELCRHNRVPPAAGRLFEPVLPQPRVQFGRDGAFTGPHP
jgi:hypothetical protein